MTNLTSCIHFLSAQMYQTNLTWLQCEKPNQVKLSPNVGHSNLLSTTYQLSK